MNKSAPKSKSRKTPLQRAKEAVGGNTALALAITGITPQAISQWDQIPLNRVFDVERATGIPRAELRPDFFGDKAGSWGAR